MTRIKDTWLKDLCTYISRQRLLGMSQTGHGWLNTERKIRDLHAG